MTGDPRLAPVAARMRAALAADEPETDGLYAWLRYQMGWADECGRPTEASGGKGMRPLLCLVACSSVGGDEVRAVPAAASVELTHAFSLIHDDIEDGDRVRRGRPALWALCGQAQGINAGDAMFAIARRELLRSAVPLPTLVEQVRRYDAACLRLAEGQYLDLAFEQDDHVSPERYTMMVARKTGALLGAAASLGALAGDCAVDQADEFGRFGEHVGIAFQIQDDVLGMWGDPDVTGKPVGADLLRRKKSFPVLLALADSGLKADIAALFADVAGEGAPDRAGDLAIRMSRFGLRERAAAAAMEHADAARAVLEGMSLRDGPMRELLHLVGRAVVRER